MFLADFLFPRFCLGCGRVGNYICLNCQQKLIYCQTDSCFYCQRPSRFGLTHPICQRYHGVDGFVSIFRYNNFLKKIIKSFKYRKAVLVWKELSLTIKPEKLSKLIFYKKLNHGKKFFLQPMPLHFKKLRTRGFNQAKVISEFFQGFLRLPIANDLVRIKETKPQAQIDQLKKRQMNVKGAFRIPTGKLVKNNNYIIIDDLLTSGKTSAEAARALKKEGANKVFILTLAKG